MFTSLERRNAHATGDAIEIPLTGRSDAATTLRILLDDTDGFELLEHSARDATGTDLVVVTTNALVTRTAVRLAQRTHTHVTLRVELASDRGSANVKPIRVVRGVLFEGGGFDDINPLRDFHLFEKKRSKSVSIARNK